MTEGERMYILDELTLGTLWKLGLYTHGLFADLCQYHGVWV